MSPALIVAEKGGSTNGENGAIDGENGAINGENGATNGENGATNEENGATNRENGATNGGNGFTDGENGATKKKTYPAPLKRTGALDGSFDFEDATPAIGREYPTVNIVDDLLHASNSDEILRDVAITSKSLTVSRAQELCFHVYDLLDDSLRLTDLDTKQSRSAVSSSSVRRTISQTTCRRSSSRS